MKRAHILRWLSLLIALVLAVTVPSLQSQEEEETFTPYPLEEMFSEEVTPPPPDLKIIIKGELPYALEPGESYALTWIIKGLEEGQELTHTDIHWEYLFNLNTPEEIESYENYWYIGQEFSWSQDEYTDELYLSPSEAQLPAIMLVIHAIVDGENITLGPIPVDIVPEFRGETE